MADRPHRAVIIYGDGLLIDGPPPSARSPEPSSRISAPADQRTPLEVVDAPALHRVAADGVSGLLALRQLPAHVSAAQREALELAQLLDVFHCAHAPPAPHVPDTQPAAVSSADPSDPSTAAAAASSAAAISWSTNPAPLSDRFIGMEASFLSSSPASLVLARAAGFRTTRLPLAAHPSSSHHLLVTGEPVVDSCDGAAAEAKADAGRGEAAAVESAAAGPVGSGPVAAAAAAVADPSVLAARIVAALGLHREEVPGPPPSAAEREPGEVDLVLVHVRPGDVGAWGGEGGKAAGGLPGGVAAGATEAAAGAVTGAGEGGGEEAGDAGATARQGKELEAWEQAERAIGWVDSLVAALLRWRDGKEGKGAEGKKEGEGPGGEGRTVPDDQSSSARLRAESHLYLAVVFGYGEQGNQQVAGALVQSTTESDQSSQPLLSLPHLAPLTSASSTDSAPPLPPRVPFVPRQSYELRGDEPVKGVRHHHPLLVTRHLPAVTRCDEATRFGMQECLQNGGDRAILADRFIYEVAFKLWRYPKYGA
ncbi:hypothetical protein CLOM_g14554 [Closterium sp. NIES-68]|nr:hypothetical protein CLOM_g14554 [Closterium sp. NIES-68]